MVYYELVKIIIDILGLAKVIINVIVHYYDISKSIITDQGLLFILIFWSLLCYFLDNKKRLFITFHLWTDSQIER